MQCQHTNPALCPVAARLFAIQLSSLLLLACLAISTTATATPNEDSSRTILHLIDYVRNSDVTFVRNFSKHTSVEAASHIMDKYRHFRDEIETPEEFIDLCATESLMTGRDYRIIDDQGRKFRTHDWLMDELGNYRRQQSPAPSE